MEENDDLAIGFLTGTAEGTREAARLQETHLEREDEEERVFVSSYLYPNPYLPQNPM